MRMGSTISDLNAASLADALRRVAAGDQATFEDVYLSVWRRAGTFDAAKGSAMAWLITLARNRAVDRLRSGGKVATTPIKLANEVPDPAPAAS